MGIKVTVTKEYDVNHCHACPHCVNTKGGHSDSFTSSPIPVFACSHPSRKDEKYFHDSFNIFTEILKDCPLIKGTPT